MQTSDLSVSDVDHHRLTVGSVKRLCDSGQRRRGVMACLLNDGAMAPKWNETRRSCVTEAL
ncbi:PAS domain-containing sensor histidine kinase [Sesbania bispinosa]|nr:PAS domain-containing sensor histidine kinase [Sesbania bispinosa]